MKFFIKTLNAFQRGKYVYFCAGLIITCFALWSALFNSPPDYQQGEYVRLMYIHVPCSWGAILAYLSMGILSIIGLISRQPKIHIMSCAIAPVGTFLCISSLITGSLWGKPIWGTYWVWDARLTSMLFLAFLYLGHIWIVETFKTLYKSIQIAAFLSIVGCINIPIIKWSVHLWTTLHQVESIRFVGKSSMHESFQLPLFSMAFGLFFLCLWNVSIFYETYKNKLIKSNRSL